MDISDLPLSGTDAVDLSVRQFREAWRLMCAGSPGFTLDEGRGVDYVFSGIPISFFNVALVTGHDLSGRGLAGPRARGVRPGI